MSSTSWDDFVRAVVKEVPGLPSSATQAFDITSHGSLGHTQRAALRHFVTRGRPGLSPDAVRACRTLGELFNLMDYAGHAIEPVTLSMDTFRTASVHFRPLLPSDHLPLYKAALDPDTAYAWRYRGRTPSFDAFQSQLYSTVLCQFVVAANDDGRMLGLVAAYEESFEAGHCRCAFQRVGDSSVDGSMLEGLVLLFEYVFRHWPIKKLYFEIPEYNRYLLKGVEDTVEVEATLRDYVWWNRRTWDLDIVAYYRETWDELREALGVVGSTFEEGTFK